MKNALTPQDLRFIAKNQYEYEITIENILLNLADAIEAVSISETDKLEQQEGQYDG